MTSAMPAVTTHGQFTLARVYDTLPASVYAAWSDPELKARWFVGPEGWSPDERALDLRVGGEELLKGRIGAGAQTSFSARYHVVEPGVRLVYAYDMHLSGRHHSTSLATVEFLADPDGTRLRVTEQLVFVDGTDGRDGALSRKRGTAAHLERLAAVIGVDLV